MTYAPVRVVIALQVDACGEIACPQREHAHVGGFQRGEMRLDLGYTDERRVVGKHRPCTRARHVTSPPPHLLHTHQAPRRGPTVGVAFVQRKQRGGRACAQGGLYDGHLGIWRLCPTDRLGNITEDSRLPPGARNTCLAPLPRARRLSDARMRSSGGELERGDDDVLLEIAEAAPAAIELDHPAPHTTVIQRCTCASSPAPHSIVTQRRACVTYVQHTAGSTSRRASCSVSLIQPLTARAAPCHLFKSTTHRASCSLSYVAQKGEYLRAGVVENTVQQARK